MKPVVFVHGFMGGSEQWQAQIDALTDFDLVTLDLPGFGKNAHLDALSSIEAYANWALDELSVRGIQNFYLIGHSMGGMIVQAMAVQSPTRVERLVLYGTGAEGALPGRFEPIETSKRRTRADGAYATARRIAATWFLDKEKAPAYEGCAAIAERCSMQAMLNGLDAINGWSGSAYLSSIKMKTLVVWGDHDRTYPWGQTEKLWQSIPNASLAVIPDCAHAVHLEKPELFNRIIGDFFVV